MQPYKCKQCKRDMNAKHLTKKHLTAKRYRYGVIWECLQCSHSCWTESTLKEHREIKTNRNLSGGLKC